MKTDRAALAADLRGECLTLCEAVLRDYAEISNPCADVGRARLDLRG